MGKADLERRMDREPPIEALNSVGALWRDHNWRKVDRGLGDPAIPYTASAKNVKDAIVRACDSRGEDGKLFFHQGRVWQVNRDRYAAALLPYADHINSMPEEGKKKGFNKLFDLCEMVGRNVQGIGPITIYDVTARLAAYLGLRANRIYLHGGVVAGVKALGLETAGRRFIRRKELPLPLCQVRNLDDVEDFLCGYRSELERLQREGAL